MTPLDQRNRSAVTLIIPTVHHRAPLYARALRQLSRAGFRGPIIVSDHSPPEHAHAIAEITKRHGELDINVLWHAPDTHFLTRLSRCTAAAETPYVHLHADDDFLVVAMLDRLVGEMERTAGCVAALGLNLHLRLDTGQISLLLKTANQYSSPFERLIAQLESYSSVLYALRRREELIANFSYTVERCPTSSSGSILRAASQRSAGRLCSSTICTTCARFTRTSGRRPWSGNARPSTSPTSDLPPSSHRAWRLFAPH